MKTDEIKQIFEKFEIAVSELEGIECWSARELQSLLGYSKWENFEKVIQKAKDACNIAGEEIDYHFPDIRKTIPMPKGAENISATGYRNKHSFRYDSVEHRIPSTNNNTHRQGYGSAFISCRS